MPQCKRSGCRLEAQKHGKRLCPAHEAERKARSGAYFSKPCCKTCGTQHTTAVGPNGKPECPTCGNARRERDKVQEIADYNMSWLERCATVEELKEFIKHNLMGA